MKYSVLVVFLVLACSPKQGHMEQRGGFLETTADRNVHRSLPAGTVIAGNLIKGDGWFLLSASEISAIRGLLEHAQRQTVNEGLPIQLPPPICKVVLWGTDEGNIVPLHVLLVDRSVSVLRPLDAKAGWYGVPDGDQRECLQRLIQRISEGKEQALTLHD